MAENKKSFILYADLIHTIKKLPIEKAGELFVIILEYVNDENPKIEDYTLDLVFEPIRQQLKRDLKSWETTIKGKSEGGKKSAEIRKKLKDVQEQLSMLNIPKDTLSNSTVNVSDNVNVSVTVNDNVNEINSINSKEFFIVNSELVLGNCVDWYVNENRILFEADLMNNQLSAKEDEIIQSLKMKFTNGSDFVDYKMLRNCMKKHIKEYANKPKLETYVPFIDPATNKW